MIQMHRYTLPLEGRDASALMEMIGGFARRVAPLHPELLGLKTAVYNDNLTIYIRVSGPDTSRTIRRGKELAILMARSAGVSPAHLKLEEIAAKARTGELQLRDGRAWSDLA